MYLLSHLLDEVLEDLVLGIVDTSVGGILAAVIDDHVDLLILEEVRDPTSVEDVVNGLKKGLGYNLVI